MSISALRTRVTTTLVEFAWDEWSQMGVFAPSRARSPWAQDPEALLLFTLEVARDEPRLFDELLDWLARNESIVSARRLRTLCESADDERLVAAALAWTARQRRRPPSISTPRPVTAEPVFRGLTTPIGTPDPAFAQQSLLRPLAEPSGHATAPDVRTPINFAFRLRHVLGVGARAEAARYLLTAETPRASVAAVTRSAGFAKRNVQEALTSLEAAGVAARVDLGGEQRYWLDRSRWATLLQLEVDDLPLHRDWPQLFRALREVVRWLARPELEELTDYMRSSRAHDLLERIAPDLAYAGVVPRRGGRGEDAWDDLVEMIERALAALRA